MPPAAITQSILIVEDDSSLLSTMREYLGRAGFGVRTAANGWEALKRVKDGPCDLVIAEITMPDMDGCGLREKFLLGPDTRDIPFLFMTPEDTQEQQLRALRAGVDDILTHPFDPIVLVARVQAVLERRRTYEEMVRVDPLTRLLNRPSVEAEIATELARVARYKRTGTLLLIDIDEFHKVNTESGTNMGDLLLTCLSGVILTSVRNVDIAGRYRGEKFLIYLPETEVEGAAKLARRIQKQVAAIADSVAGYPLSFSCGLAHAPEAGTTLPELYPHLEEALNNAKKQGHGRMAAWGYS
jgi:two-component system cell cycle response regulator